MYKKNIISAMFLRLRHGKSLALLEGCRPKTVLDVGCDDGVFIARFAEMFPSAKISAVDFDADALSEARNACPDAVFYEEDFMTLSFPPADLVVMLEVLEHAKDPEAMLRKAARIAGKKGRILISIPRAEVLHWRIIWWLWSNTLGRRWRGQHGDMSEEDLLDLAKRCGLVCERKKRFFLGSVVIMLLKPA
ncbi:MAG: class I SAM-dependent methyltransferase [Candidatus Micrarchaeota archaeon]